MSLRDNAITLMEQWISEEADATQRRSRTEAARLRVCVNELRALLGMEPLDFTHRE